MAIAPLPSPLASRLSTLPLVLAGPILRTVHAQQVTVWIALRSAQTVTLTVKDVNQATLFSGSTTTTKVGQNLYIAVVVAVPTTPLSPDVVYYYDLSFGGSFTSLSAAGVLTTDGGLAAMEKYVAYAQTGKPRLPAFSLPPSNINNLRLAHGSCRRPHSYDLDALRTVDVLLTNTAHDPAARIHQLFLTGDQIYADDVADPLLRMLTDAGDTLLGLKEPLPGLSPGAVSSDLAPGQRQKVMDKMVPDPDGGGQDAFTSDAARSHLISLSEFIAMYLFCWSDVLWPDTLPTSDQTYDDGKEHLSDSNFHVQIVTLIAFHRSLPRVRRVLANIPTYMIFDDHEVTDDWYLHRRWAFRVFDKPLGRRVIQNGLVAFSLFQACGNTPDRFTGSAPGAGLFTELQGWVQDGMSATSSHLAGIQSHLPIPTSRAIDTFPDVALPHFSSHVRFDYILSWPTHNLVALDTRTWRGFRKSDDMHVALFTQAGIDAQFSNLPTVPAGGLTIVLLAGPTWMPPSFEAVLDTIGTVEPANYYIDGRLEGLSQDVFSYENVLSRLAYAPVPAGQPQDVRYLILSGDVHLGMATRLQYWSTKAVGATSARPARMVFANLTSSGLKNEVGLTLQLHTIGFKLGNSPQEDVIRLVWDTDSATPPLVAAKGQPLIPGVVNDDAQIVATFDSVAKMAVLKDRNDAVRTYVSAHFGTAAGLTEPTRTSVLSFIPSTLQRIGPADINQLATLPSGIDQATRRQRVAELFATKKNAIDNIKNSAPGKQLLGKHNVGIITFSGFGTATPKIVQELRWWRLDGDFLHFNETDHTEVVADAISHQEVSMAFLNPPALDKVGP